MSSSLPASVVVSEAQQGCSGSIRGSDAEKNTGRREGVTPRQESCPLQSDVSLPLEGDADTDYNDNDDDYNHDDGVAESEEDIGSIAPIEEYAPYEEEEEEQEDGGIGAHHTSNPISRAEGVSASPTNNTAEDNDDDSSPIPNNINPTNNNKNTITNNTRCSLANSPSPSAATAAPATSTQTPTPAAFRQPADWEAYESNLLTNRTRRTRRALQQVLGGELEEQPRVAVVFSGGGWRALTSGVAFLDALATPLSEIVPHAPEGFKVIDSVTHAVGLSGGSWALATAIASSERMNPYHVNLTQCHYDAAGRIVLAAGNDPFHHHHNHNTPVGPTTTNAANTNAQHYNNMAAARARPEVGRAPAAPMSTLPSSSSPSPAAHGATHNINQTTSSTAGGGSGRSAGNAISYQQQRISQQRGTVPYPTTATPPSSSGSNTCTNSSKVVVHNANPWLYGTNNHFDPSIHTYEGLKYMLSYENVDKALARNGASRLFARLLPFDTSVFNACLSGGEKDVNGKKKRSSDTNSSKNNSPDGGGVGSAGRTSSNLSRGGAALASPLSSSQKGYQRDQPQPHDCPVIEAWGLFLGNNILSFLNAKRSEYIPQFAHQEIRGQEVRTELRRFGQTRNSGYSYYDTTGNMAAAAGGGGAVVGVGGGGGAVNGSGRRPSTTYYATGIAPSAGPGALTYGQMRGGVIAIPPPAATTCTTSPPLTATSSSSSSRTPPPSKGVSPAREGSGYGAQSPAATPRRQRTVTVLSPPTPPASSSTSTTRVASTPPPPLPPSHAATAPILVLPTVVTAVPERSRSVVDVTRTPPQQRCADPPRTTSTASSALTVPSSSVNMSLHKRLSSMRPIIADGDFPLVICSAVASKQHVSSRWYRSSVAERRRRFDWVEVSPFYIRNPSSNHFTENVDDVRVEFVWGHIATTSTGAQQEGLAQISGGGGGGGTLPSVSVGVGAGGTDGAPSPSPSSFFPWSRRSISPQPSTSSVNGVTAATATSSSSSFFLRDPKAQPAYVHRLRLHQVMGMCGSAFAFDEEVLEENLGKKDEDREVVRKEIAKKRAAQKAARKRREAEERQQRRLQLQQKGKGNHSRLSDLLHIDGLPDINLPFLPKKNDDTSNLAAKGDSGDSNCNTTNNTNTTNNGDSDAVAEDADLLLAALEADDGSSSEGDVEAGPRLGSTFAKGTLTTVTYGPRADAPRDTCRDAGLDFNIPFPAVFKGSSGRSFDIVIAMDAGAGSVGARELAEAVRLGYVELVGELDPSTGDLLPLPQVVFGGVASFNSNTVEIIKQDAVTASIPISTIRRGTATPPPPPTPSPQPSPAAGAGAAYPPPPTANLAVPCCCISTAGGFTLEGNALLASANNNGSMAVGAGHTNSSNGNGNGDGSSSSNTGNVNGNGNGNTIDAVCEAFTDIVAAADNGCGDAAGGGGDVLQATTAALSMTADNKTNTNGGGGGGGMGMTTSSSMSTTNNDNGSTSVSGSNTTRGGGGGPINIPHLEFEEGTRVKVYLAADGTIIIYFLALGSRSTLSVVRHPRGVERDVAWVRKEAEAVQRAYYQCLKLFARNRFKPGGPPPPPPRRPPPHHHHHHHGGQSPSTVTPRGGVERGLSPTPSSVSPANRQQHTATTTRASPAGRGGVNTTVPLASPSPTSPAPSPPTHRAHPSEQHHQQHNNDEEKEKKVGGMCGGWCGSK